MLLEEQWGPVTLLRVTRTFFGRPVRWVNAYALDGLLIDSGPYWTRREMVAAARRLGVTQLYTTHEHEDHCGGNGALYAGLGLVPQAGAATVPHLIAPPRIHLYRKIVWGDAPPTPAQAVTHVDTDHYHFDVIPTPGHSADHTVLYEPTQGWVFSGDLYLHERAKYIRTDEDLAALIESLRRVAALEPRVLFCAHAGVVEQPSEAIARKLAYWEELRVKAAALEEQGEPLPDVSAAVMGPEGPMTRFSRGHISKLNLTRALVALPHGH
ncbi:MAG: MBL fold metallo-hydrolase [Anaerolineae bacterium]